MLEDISVSKYYEYVDKKLKKIDVIEKIEITQGEIFLKFPVFVSKLKETSSITDFQDLDQISKVFQTHVEYVDLIVMTQACDLTFENDRIPDDKVICAALHPITSVKKDAIPNIIKLQKMGYYYLGSDNLLNESKIINFYDLHVVEYKMFQHYIHNTNKQDRIKPQSPILEKISHQFGNFFSRIGLNSEFDISNLENEYNSRLITDLEELIYYYNENLSVIELNKRETIEMYAQSFEEFKNQMNKVITIVKGLTSANEILVETAEGILREVKNKFNIVTSLRVLLKSSEKLEEKVKKSFTYNLSDSKALEGSLSNICKNYNECESILKMHEKIAFEKIKSYLESELDRLKCL